MRALLRIMAVIAVAVGLVALAARSSAGYVQIVWPPHRIELSLVLVIVLLVTAFALMYLGLRLVSAMVAMPQKVREYRQARRKRKAHEALTGALHEFFSGRFARAEKAATSAMELGEQPGLAAMLAARAAHELRAPERRDAHLAQAATHLPDDDIMRVITEADMLLEQRRAADALSVLQTLPQKHTAGLRLELKALQLTKEWEKSLTVIDQLEKRKVYDAVQARELRCHALVEHLKRRATDVSALDEACRKVPDALRRDARIARAAAQGYAALKAGERAADVIERSLDQSWDSDLAGLYADCAGADAVTQIERAERWLAAHPGDAALLLTLGRLCARQSLWGKAQNYLDASIAVEATYSAYLAAAQLHEKLGDVDVAQRHTRKALELALAKLHERLQSTLV
ncbi:MAG TPA: heme biosynthesis HemY N-terminal domain-containing protein [Burkholderiales bacterium]|nr:heme biosynthesis HemY N-terminal domain-containing protein [Burkholderiales bacterium]